VRTYLKKIGALNNSARAVWSLTDTGDQLKEAEARDVFRRVNAEARASEDQTEPTAEPETVGPTATPDDATWVDRLLEVIGSISPDAFERLSQRLLRESGFTKVEMTGKSGDGGIDGIGVLRMNLVSFQVLFSVQALERFCGTQRRSGFSRSYGGAGGQGSHHHHEHVHRRCKA
jgi:restriction system protein